MPLPENYTIRAPQKADHAAYIETLQVLTTVGDVTLALFADLLEEWNLLSSVYHPRVIVDENNTVVATGMLVVEKKLIHGCGKVGHIEDIAVASGQQGKRLGNQMIASLSEIAKENGCYKVILDCLAKNVGFYEKCGYKNAGVQMSKRYD